MEIFFLQMTLPDNKLKAMYLKVTLKPNDTYTMAFLKITDETYYLNMEKYEMETLKEIKRLDSYMLEDVFQRETGLATRN